MPSAEDYWELERGRGEQPGSTEEAERRAAERALAERIAKAELEVVKASLRGDQQGAMEAMTEAWALDLGWNGEGGLFGAQEYLKIIQRAGDEFQVEGDSEGGITGEMRG